MRGLWFAYVLSEADEQVVVFLPITFGKFLPENQFSFIGRFGF